MVYMNSLATSYSHRGKPQLPSALKSLTSVFGMGTGVTSSPSLPDNIIFEKTLIIIIYFRNFSRGFYFYIPSKLDNKEVKFIIQNMFYCLAMDPRPSATSILLRNPKPRFFGMLSYRFRS